MFAEVVLADALSHGEYKIRELKATKKTSLDAIEAVGKAEG